jgi:pilus assembly protein Flp/PilA
MRDLAWTLYCKALALVSVLREDAGQDMVEYAMVLGLIALGSAAAINGLATTLSTGITAVGAKLSTYTS